MGMGALAISESSADESGEGQRAMLVNVVENLGSRVQRWAESKTPWTNVYGLARSLLAIGSIITLALNDPNQLFRPAVGIPQYPICEGVAGFGWFCQFEGDLGVSRWLAVVVLVIVASGWRPRVTGPLHWWIACSYQANAIVVDGGDQVAAVLTLLLLPVTLTDDRRWHWGRPRNHSASLERRLVAASALVAIRFQVAAIYLHAAVGKFAVEEWVNGTGVYYFFSDPLFGANPLILELVMPLARHPLGVAAITWGTLALELFLAAALVMDRKRWWPWLIAGLSLHAGIAIVHGLISFMFSMWAALILYLRPHEEPFSFAKRVQGRAGRRGRPKGLRASAVERVPLPRSRHFRRGVIACLLASLASGGCTEASVGEERCTRVREHLSDALAPHLIPGAAMFMDVDGHTCLATAGVGDLDTRRPIDGETRFQVGSVSKMFVATIALQLVEETRLSLDDTVARWFPDIPFAEEMTVAHLLEHTSGLADYTTSGEFWNEALADPKRSWREEELLAFAFEQGPLFEPGEDWEYSNAGYVLLAMIVERVLGHSIEQEIEVRIVEVLGMAHTTVSVNSTDDEMAEGYGRPEPTDRLRNLTHAVDPTAFGPGGAIATTTEDLALFLRGLDRDLLSPAMWRTMTRIRSTTSERYPGAGLGVRTRLTPVGLAIGATGRLPGYTSIALRLEDVDGVAVILANRQLGSELDTLLDETLVLTEIADP